MRGGRVIDALPGADLTVETLDRKAVEGAQFIELLGMLALGALDRTIELGRARRQHEQRRSRRWQAASFGTFGR